MKKVVSLILAAVLALALAACGSDNEVTAVSQTYGETEQAITIEADTVEPDETETGDELTFLTMDLLGVTTSEAIDLWPGENVDYELTEDEESWVNTANSLVFSTFDEEDYPDLVYDGGDAGSTDLVVLYLNDLTAYSAYLAITEDNSDAWDSTVSLVMATAEFVDAALAPYVPDGYKCTMLLQSSEDTSKTLLAVYDGEVFYDAVEDWQSK